jgi:hypothetical protein
MIHSTTRTGHGWLLLHLRGFFEEAGVSPRYGLHREDALVMKYLRLSLCVTPKNVRTTVLEIPGGNQDYVAILDPGPSLHLATYPTDPVGPV